MSIEDPQSGNDHIAVPESLQVFGMRISLTLRFLKLHAEFYSAHVRCAAFWITHTNVNISTNEYSSTSQNVLNETSKNSQC